MNDTTTQQIPPSGQPPEPAAGPAGATASLQEPPIADNSSGPSRPAGTGALPYSAQSPEARARAWRAALGGIALTLTLVTLVLLGVQWYSSRSTVEALRHELARRLAEGEAQNKESRVLAEQTREAVAETQVKLGVLESRFAETQNQQIALEALYQELSRNRDEWAFADIEQSLLIASQQLQLAGNVKVALIALQNADARLQRMERPQLTALRKAIHRDLENLKALPHVDTVGMTVRLDNVIAGVDTLPLAMEVRPPQSTRSEVARPPQMSAWRRFVHEAWLELTQLLRVQHMDRPDIPLLAPEQSFFLRENLKLRLLGARLSLLSREPTSYKSDLSAAREWIIRYYDTREKSVETALSTLRKLHESDVSIELPDISATLDALRALRLARERPAANS